MPYRLVIFDCDGVLVDSERLVNEIESRFFTRLGWPLSPEEAGALFKGRTVTEIARLVEKHLKERTSVDWMFEWAMVTAWGFVERLRSIEGVHDVLLQLKRVGTDVCVASQSPLPRVRLSLALCQLAAFFGDRIYTASMVERGKPAPDLFLYASRQLDVPPVECAVIEDSINGVQAAVAAGMTVYGYAADENAEQLAEAGAIVFRRMAELPPLLSSTKK